MTPEQLGFGMVLPIEEGGIDYNHPGCPPDVWRKARDAYLAKCAAMAQVPFLGTNSPEPAGTPRDPPASLKNRMDECGLSVLDATTVITLLLTIFNDDTAAAGRWLGQYCGPLWAKPIDALKAGQVERVVKFLRQAAP